jgi:hypothetical protein
MVKFRTSLQRKWAGAAEHASNKLKTGILFFNYSRIPEVCGESKRMSRFVLTRILQLSLEKMRLQMSSAWLIIIFHSCVYSKHKKA